MGSYSLPSRYWGNIRPQVLFAVLLLCLSYSVASCAAGDIGVSIQPDVVQAEISPYVVGIHFVYSDAKDSIYEDGRVADWSKSAGIGVARFPGGGALKGWDWQNPTGLRKVDRWDPDYQGKVSPESDWMSLDEFLQFVGRSGVTPLIGVDYLSGLKFGKREQSVKRAADLVKYVKDAGYPGTFYYIGNEDIHLAGGIRQAASAFVDHAKAMKAVDPAIKIFWNDNSVNPKRLKEYLTIAGKWADGVELHGKWPYGGNWSKEAYRLRDWQDQSPIKDAKRGIYSKRIKKLRKVAKDAGYPDLLFANNEYGLHASKNRFVDFSRYSKSLATLDYLIDLIVGDYDMTSFWSNVGDEKFLMDERHGYRMNPVHIGLGMLAQVQGTSMVKYQLNGKRLNGFVAKTKDGRLLVVLLNKDDKARKVKLTLDPRSNSSLSGRMTVMQDSADHWGEKVVSDVGDLGKGFSIPPLSLVLLDLPLR